MQGLESTSSACLGWHLRTCSLEGTRQMSITWNYSHNISEADSERLAGSVSCLKLSSLNCSFFFLKRGLQISFSASALSTCNWGWEICWNILCSCLRETHILKLETWRLLETKNTPVSRIFFISFSFKERVKISNRIDQSAVSRKCLEATKV